MSNLTIGKKIALGYLLLVGLSLLTSLFTLSMITGVDKRLDISQERVVELALISDLNAHLLQLNLAYMNAIVDADTKSVAPEIAKVHTTTVEWFNANRAAFEAAVDTAEERAMLAKMVTLVEQHFQQGQSLLAAITAGLEAAQLDQYDDELDNRAAIIFDLGKSFEKELAAEQKEDSEVAMQFVHWTLVLQYIASCLLLLIGSLVAWFMTRNIRTILESLVEDLVRASQKTLQAAASLTTTATELSHSSHEQASSVEETTSALEEIGGMISKTAEAIQESKKLSQASAVASGQGVNSVGQMVQVIEAINLSSNQMMEQLEGNSRNIEAIVKVIRNIGDKTKVINDIVFQTKLLAFNASVEAARAGAHGKGFAVVAEEVGNLASMSGNASKEISELLEQSLANVNQIVAETKGRAEQILRDGREQVATGKGQSQDCQQALAHIAHKVEESQKVGDQIALAAQEQTQGVKEITKAMAMIDTTTQKNTQLAQATQSSSQELSLLAKELGLSVERIENLVYGRSSTAEDQSRFIDSSQTPVPDHTTWPKAA